jgi:hypothetical protein
MPQEVRMELEPMLHKCAQLAQSREYDAGEDDAGEDDACGAIDFEAIAEDDVLE